MNATRLETCQLNLAIAFGAFEIRMVVKAVQICVITAFSVLPMNVLMWSNCLISQKNSFYLPTAFVAF